MPASFLLEDILDFDDGENIVLDGTETFTPPAQNITFKVRVARNAADTANIFYIDDRPQPRLALMRVILITLTYLIVHYTMLTLQRTIN